MEHRAEGIVKIDHSQMTSNLYTLYRHSPTRKITSSSALISKINLESPILKRWLSILDFFMSFKIVYWRIENHFCLSFKVPDIPSDIGVNMWNGGRGMGDVAT